ncbi:MAG: SRPBCC family protein [Steroidobacteraceae bacterium]
MRELLHPIAEHVDPYQPEKWVHVLHFTAEVVCHWKVIHDNFNEPCHLTTLHRELNTFIEDSYLDTQFDLYESGHNRMLMKTGLLAHSSGNVNQASQPAAGFVFALECERCREIVSCRCRSSLQHRFMDVTPQRVLRPRPPQ